MSDESTDIVFIESLFLSTNIGPDWWGRARSQPVTLSVYLHLMPSHLTAAGTSDSVTDTVHYGHLSKALSALAYPAPFQTFSSNGAWYGLSGLSSAAAGVALDMGGDAVRAVRVVLRSEKMLPLAGALVLEEVRTRDGMNELPRCVKMEVNELVLPCIIGVNPPEREAKQRVVTNITVHEAAVVLVRVDYPAIVASVAQHIEASSYLTLEKFALDIVRMVCLASEGIESVTVRAKKPSAVSFADAAGVQITRKRTAFL